VTEAQTEGGLEKYRTESEDASKRHTGSDVRPTSEMGWSVVARGRTGHRQKEKQRSETGKRKDARTRVVKCRQKRSIAE